MNRVKDLSKIKLRGDMLLCECFEDTSSLIIKPGTEGGEAASIAYSKVINVGHNVDDIEVGDIVFDTVAGMKVTEYEIGGEKRMFTVLQRNNCKFICSPDNFDIGS